MPDFSLRQRIQLLRDTPGQGVRECCAPYMRSTPISLRTFVSAPRIVHISDLHFSTHNYLNTGDPRPNTADHDLHIPFESLRLQSQDTPKRSDLLASYLLHNKPIFGTNILVITGDLTDSGDQDDYTQYAEPFVERLGAPGGYRVYSNPGNHDYCKMGTIRISDWMNSLLGTFGLGNSDSNQQRRQSFIQYITHYNDYPHPVPLEGGQLILLDSMQAELDEDTGDEADEGKLGDLQLYGPDGAGGLQKLVDDYQPERQKGKKLIVSLHHSPFKTMGDGSMDLRDAIRFLAIVNGKIDCLLYGHTTPNDAIAYGPLSDDDPDIVPAELQIPLISCVNLQNVTDDGVYPIVVLDPGSGQRVVFFTNGDTPKRSWANPWG